MLKPLMAILAALPGLALGAVVTYDDGTTYTLAESEQIFISSEAKLYLSESFNGDNILRFVAIQPNEARDYVEPETSDPERGSPEWCDWYAPQLWSQGYTFDDQLFIRACGEG